MSLFAGPMPLQTFKSYKNDLFGDEEGDVLASETIPSAKPIDFAVPTPTSPSNRVQQQIALNQQKRLARLQVTLCTVGAFCACLQPGSCTCVLHTQALSARLRSQSKNAQPSWHINLGWVSSHILVNQRNNITQ